MLFKAKFTRNNAKVIAFKVAHYTSNAKHTLGFNGRKSLLKKYFCYY